MKNSAFGNMVDMRNIKRGIAALLAGCLLVGSLAACGDKEKEKDNSGADSGVVSPIPLMTPSPEPQSMAKAVKVKVDDSLNVRASASTDSNVLGQVEDGDKLALLSDTPQNGWYNVQYNGTPAYVSAEYVEVIDVTVEQYQQLMATPAATATPDAEPTSDPDSTATPNPDDPGAAATTAPGADNEDGE